MSILEEIAGVLSLPYSDVLKELNIHIFSNKSVSICNFISILGYDRCKVVLKVKDNVLVINGENLQINDIDGRSIIVVGKITGMEYSR